MTLLTRAAIGVRHAIKRLIFPRLPQGLQEAMDRRFYYRRFAGGDLSWEPELRLLRELVQPGELAIDVGANLGGYSIELSRLVGPLGEVRAFEPVERTFRLLNYNLGRLGAHHNYRTYLCAVGDRTGTANMYVPLEGSLPNYYVASLRAPRDRAVTQRVELVRLDDAVTASPRRIALVKIDVEGSEYSVLLGAEHLLRTHEPSVICEVSRAPGDRPEAVFRFFKRLAYSAFRYRDGGLVPVDGLDDDHHPNYVFIPQSRISRVTRLLNTLSPPTPKR